MIIYASRTGNVKWVANQLEGIACVDIKDLKGVSEDYIIFTYTDGLGLVPSHVEKFLDSNHKHLQGVIASGNLNFGVNFCSSADKISEKYGVPIIAKLDLRGTSHDRRNIEIQYRNIIKEG